MLFTGYKYVALALVLIEIAIILLAFRRQPSIAILATFASIALKGQYIWIGNPVYAWHVSAMLGLLIAVAAKRGLTPAPGRPLDFFRIGMISYFAYNLLISVPMWALLAFDSVHEAAVGTSVSRIVTQSVYLLFQAGLFVFGMYAARHTSIVQFVRMIVVLATVVAYFAILQVIVFMTFNLNLFPIIGSDDTVRSAFLGRWTFRATSFAGEPKHLGILMSIGLATYFITRIFRIHMGKLSIHIPVAMISAILLSLSSTGIYLAVMAIILLTFAFFPRLRRVDLLAVTLVALIAVSQVGKLSGEFVDALGYQASKLDVEVQDQSIRDALMHAPMIAILGAGLGNIHNYAVAYLPYDFPLFRDAGYKANSGLFYILGDSGIFGLGLFLLAHTPAIVTYRRLRRALHSADRVAALVALALLFVSLASFMLRYNELHFLIAGFVYARLASIRQSVLTDRNKAALLPERAAHGPPAALT